VSFIHNKNTDINIDINTNINKKEINRICYNRAHRVFYLGFYKINVSIILSDCHVRHHFCFFKKSGVGFAKFIDEKSLLLVFENELL